MVLSQFSSYPVIVFRSTKSVTFQLQPRLHFTEPIFPCLACTGITFQTLPINNFTFLYMYKGRLKNSQYIYTRQCTCTHCIVKQQVFNQKHCGYRFISYIYLYGRNLEKHRRWYTTWQKMTKQKWEKCWAKCITSHWEYLEGDCFKILYIFNGIPPCNHRLPLYVNPVWFLLLHASTVWTL